MADIETFTLTSNNMPFWVLFYLCTHIFHYIWPGNGRINASEATLMVDTKVVYMPQHDPEKYTKMFV